MKARSAPGLLRQSAELAWKSRWWAMLSVTAQSSFGQSLVEEHVEAHFPDEDVPDLGNVLTDGRLLDAP
eukprot:4453165-Karenia_brevis.AAC.1